MLNEVAPGDNFIVGMWHNPPFDGKLERIASIVELIDKHGRGTRTVYSGRLEVKDPGLSTLKRLKATGTR